MKELICPNCHKAFTVDEAGYASIVNQVKNAEFDAEINRRLAELHERHKAEEALVAAKAEQQYQQERSRQAQKLSEKEAEIARLQTARASPCPRHPIPRPTPQRSCCPRILTTCFTSNTL